MQTHTGPVGPASRTLRAAVFAALLVLLAGLGQVLVTGRPLPLGTLAVAGAAVFAVAFALAGPGFWYPPTVLAPTDPDAPAVTEEIFGPVAV
ncbi:aldehyde dehydrogenase family protein, partial [Kitasatospora sp. NPDC001574]